MCWNWCCFSKPRSRSPSPEYGFKRSRRPLPDDLHAEVRRLTRNRPKKETGVDDRKTKRKEPMIIYSDGSCVKEVASGYGIFVPKNQKLNRSERISTPPHEPARAEIFGAFYALKNTLEWKQYDRKQPVIVRTDCLLLIRAVHGKLNGVSPSWLLDDLRVHRSDLDALRAIVGLFPGGVTFEHVKGHSGEPGNEAADELARLSLKGINSKRRRY